MRSQFLWLWAHSAAWGCLFFAVVMIIVDAWRRTPRGGPPGQPPRTSAHSSTRIAAATNSTVTETYRRQPRIVGQPPLQPCRVHEA
jgi:hypothetical protein